MKEEKDQKTIRKRIISLITAAVFAVGTFAVPGMINNVNGAEGNDLGENYVEGQVIVCYADPEDVDMTKKQEKQSDKLLGDADELIQKENVDIENVNISEKNMSDEVTDAGKIDETIAVVESDSKSTETLISDMEKLPNVDYVEPNYTFKLGEEDALVETAIADDYTADQWAFNGTYNVNVPNWNVRTPEKPNENAAGTVVAILDSGVDYKHEDLKNVMWRKSADPNATKLSDFGEYGVDTYYGDKDPKDDYFHGTHCAGIVAAEWGNGGVAGVANGTKIMAIKASSKNGSLDMSSILEGYEKITEAKEAGVNVVAVNNSWGGRVASATSLNDAITKAGEAGVVSVFASANDGINCDPSSWLQQIPYFIKDNPYKIVVNSIDESGAKSSFSNYGVNTTDVAAPGRDIMSTLRGNTYGKKSGTSMATPVVTGEVAIVESLFGEENYGADVIAAIVKGNVKPIDSMSGKCASGGMADVSKALSITDQNDIKYKNFYLEYSLSVYNGMEKKPTVKVAGLKEATPGLSPADGDYTVSYANNTDAGTATVNINVTNNKFSGNKKITKNFSITKATPKVSLSSTYFIYNGRNKNVSVTVKDVNGENMSVEEDYLLTGSTIGKNPGTYKVQVNMTDNNDLNKNYNNASASFAIAVQSTSIAKLSRGKKSFTVKAAQKSNSLVSGYQVRYSLYGSMSGAKIKTIGTKYNKTSKTIKSLKKKRNYYVQVRTYKNVGTAKYYSDWSGIRAVRTK